MSPSRPDNAEPEEPTLVNNGEIIGPPIAPTIRAIAYLLLVTIFSFLAALFIGRLTGDNQVSYWLIELIFALLCGGAGALLGGSADVRSTFNIPGSPVKARIGGAVAMVVVGFALAYIARPKDQTPPRYTVELQNVPQTWSVDNVEYNVYAGAVNNTPISVEKSGNVVKFSIPTDNDQYQASLAIYTRGTDTDKVFARCILIFETSNASAPITREIVPESDEVVPELDGLFHFYLRDKYIEDAVRQSIRTGHSVESDSCLEGVTRTTGHDREILGRHFILFPADKASLRFWLANAFHFSAPSYGIMASVITSDEPPGGPTEPPADVTVPSAPPPQKSASANPAVPPAVPNQATPAPTQPLPLPPVIRPPVRSNTPPTAQALRTQVDAYIQGKNLNRTQLFQHWDEVNGYVVQGFRAAVASGSSSVARYVNLITNALSAIDDGKYLAPTLRYNSDQSTKPDRLGPNNLIPGFENDDYINIVELLCSSDTYSRAASRRLLRFFPADSFYAPLQRLKNRANCKSRYVGQSAVYYFYNRIVEYDGTWPLDGASRNWLDTNLADGKSWVKLASAMDSNQAGYGALLEFAYGLDLWDRSDNPASQTSAKPHFKSMLAILGASKEPYPFSPSHIAIALRAIHDQSASETADSATSFNPRVLHLISENYIVGPNGVDLLATPERKSSTKAIGHLIPGGNVRIYLRASGWDLVQSGTQLGWAQRVVKTSSN